RLKVTWAQLARYGCNLAKVCETNCHPLVTRLKRCPYSVTLRRISSSSGCSVGSPPVNATSVTLRYACVSASTFATTLVGRKLGWPSSSRMQWVQLKLHRLVSSKISLIPCPSAYRGGEPGLGVGISGVDRERAGIGNTNAGEQRDHGPGGRFEITSGEEAVSAGLSRQLRQDPHVVP